MDTLIHAGDAETRSAAVGYCIYCGATEYRPGTEEPLHDEHVVPEGLGGTLVLAEASCRQCEQMINPFEQKVIRVNFQMARLRLGVHRKRRARNADADALMVTIQNEDGSESSARMPPDLAPSLFFLPNFGPPASLIGFGAGILTGYYLHSFDRVSDMLLRLGSPKGFASPTLDAWAFGRFLAKVAHGYAHYAAFARGPFGPTLQPLIRGEGTFPDVLAPVGGTGVPPKRADALHELSLSVQDWGRGPVIVAHVRLFASLDTPRYAIVVGTNA